jgi:hypothetical protein
VLLTKAPDRVASACQTSRIAMTAQTAVVSPEVV